jgi:hypothetical protein
MENTINSYYFKANLHDFFLKWNKFHRQQAWKGW